MEKKKDAEKRNQKTYYCFIIFIFACLFAFSVFLFLTHYKKLEASLSAERTVYISELSNQLINKVNSTQIRYIKEVNMYADILNYTQPDKFSKAADLFKNLTPNDYKQIFLVDSEGDVWDLNKHKYKIDNSDIILKLIYQKQNASSFERTVDGKERWIFGSPVRSFMIDGLKITAVLKSFDISLFQSTLSLELFNQEGYSFIVSLDGSIIIGPRINVPFGYNLLSSFKELGAGQKACERIKNNFKNKKDGCTAYMRFDHADWLVQYTLLDNRQQFIFVMVPVSVTAALPIKNMNLTLMTSLFATCIAAAGFLLFVIFVFHQNREKDARIYQAELLAKSAEAKSDFLAKMSHDIRTPLNAIIGMNYIASTHIDDKEVLIDSHTKVDASANYLLDIINDVLDMSKIESGKLSLNIKPFDVKALLDNINTMINPRAKEKNIIFEINSKKQYNFEYLGDKLRINQILMNLLSNAVKFTDTGGTVTLSLAVTSLDNAKDLFTFKVSDTGIGMSQDYLNRLFQPFEQEEANTSAVYGGSGLGLAIVHNLVELIGGTVSVESVKGKGSCFTVTMSLEKVKKAGGQDTKQKQPADLSILKDKRVLLVEDNELNMEIAETILTMNGLHVDTAENGEIAVRQFLNSKRGYYSFIITDIRMPVMDGYTEADNIRNSDHPDAKSIPIIAMSANAFDEDVQASLSHHMNAHLKKPIVVTELLETLCFFIKNCTEGPPYET